MKELGLARMRADRFMNPIEAPSPSARQRGETRTFLNLSGDRAFQTGIDHPFDEGDDLGRYPPRDRLQEFLRALQPVLDATLFDRVRVYEDCHWLASGDEKGSRHRRIERRTGHTALAREKS